MVLRLEVCDAMCFSSRTTRGIHKKGIDPQCRALLQSEIFSAVALIMDAPFVDFQGFTGTKNKGKQFVQCEPRRYIAQRDKGIEGV